MTMARPPDKDCSIPSTRVSFYAQPLPRQIEAYVLTGSGCCDHRSVQTPQACGLRLHPVPREGRSLLASVVDAPFSHAAIEPGHF